MLRRLRAVRDETMALAEGLSDADATAQSMEDASPAKWHLGHTSWFFEALVLQPALPGYEIFNDRYAYLFNSYYDSVGPRQPRPQRGLLTRPPLEDVVAYRRNVDAGLNTLMASDAVDDALLRIIELGMHHEQQHQELMLTDIKHVLSCNPLQPTMNRDLLKPEQVTVNVTLLGGAFGRKAKPDFVAEAAWLAQHLLQQLPLRPTISVPLWKPSLKKGLHKPNLTQKINAALY